MVWASSCSCACSVLFVPHPVSRDSAITSVTSTEIRRHNVLLFIELFTSQRLGGCRFSEKLLWLTCRTSLPAIIGVRPVLHRQKAFKKPLERYCTTGIYKYFITITTSFQQETALKHSRCLTVAQTAAKRTIRADLPSVQQPKKKSSAGQG